MNGKYPVTTVTPYESAKNVSGGSCHSMTGKKNLMAGNNRFIRVENLFDKIHAHKLIHSHMSGIKSIVK